MQDKSPKALRTIQIHDYTSFKNLPDPGNVGDNTNERSPEELAAIRARLVAVGGERSLDSAQAALMAVFQSGIQDGINWAGIEFGFQFRSGSDGAQVGAAIDYTLAVYERYREYIQSNFTGEEFDKHMAMLHELIARNMEKIADGYADNIGAFLEKYGVESEHNVLKESIFALFDESLSAKSGVSLADFGISAPDNKSGNLYSMDEILALAFMQAPAGKGVPLNRDRRDGTPEGLIVYALKKEFIYEAFSISDSVKGKIETVFSNSVNSFIDDWNKSYEKQMSMPGANTYSKDFLAKIAPYDRELVWQDINEILENMRSGLSVVDALKKTGWFDVFIKEVDTTKFENYFGESSLADDFNSFLTQMGLIRQLSIEGIDWTV